MRSERAKEFFQQHSLATNTFYQTDGSTNQSVDASGWMPSVDATIAKQIAPYIQQLFPREHPIVHLDCGTGLGYLPKTLNELGFNSYGIEGASYLVNNSDTYIDPDGYHDALGPHPGILEKHDRILITDLCKPITDIRLNKTFHISTSFEVIEHINRKDQFQFWKNIAFLSDYHLCAIHIANDEHDHHCTINSPHTWQRIFNDLGIEWRILSDFPIKNWDCSVFFLLKMPQSISDKNVNFGYSQILPAIKSNLFRNNFIRRKYYRYKALGFKGLFTNL
jgi:hypothetical protein